MIIETKLGPTDISNVNLNCECGGKKEYTGFEKTSYPGICDWVCNGCGKTGEHRSVFPKGYREDLRQYEAGWLADRPKHYYVMYEDLVDAWRNA